MQEQRLPNATSVDAEDTPPITPTTAQHSKVTAPLAPLARSLARSLSLSLLSLLSLCLSFYLYFSLPFSSISLSSFYRDPDSESFSDFFFTRLALFFKVHLSPISNVHCMKYPRDFPTILILRRVTLGTYVSFPISSSSSSSPRKMKKIGKVVKLILTC